MANVMRNGTRDELDTDPREHEPTALGADAEASPCVRCGGFLVSNHCLDLESSWGDRWCRTLRCVQCGELIDPVILHNRRRSIARLGRVQEGAAQPQAHG